MSYKLEPIKNIHYIIDYYHILNLKKDSDISEIKKQYKKLSKEYHPDKFETAGDEIKKLSNKKIVLISEGYQILSNESLRKKYDTLYNDFEQNKPKLISKDGTPILDMSSESFHLDMILLGEGEFSTKKEQELKINQLVGHNDIVLELLEKNYQENPSNEEIKKAYIDCLLKKKIYLDFQEDFAWQELGVLNCKLSINNPDNYLDSINNKISEVTKNYRNQLEIRLLPGNAPLLLKSTTSKELIKINKIDENVNNHLSTEISLRSEKLKKVSQQKVDFLKKFSKINRKFDLLFKTDSTKTIVVILASKEAVLTSFLLKFTSDNQSIIEIFNDFDLKPLQDLPKEFEGTCYQLEFNPELEIIFQVIEFLNELVNGD